MPRRWDDLGDLPAIAMFPEAISTAQYRDIAVDRAHPLYHEEMVELRDLGIAGAPYYYRDDGGNAPYGRRLDGAVDALLLRKTVAMKLLAAQDALAPLGVGLYVWDAYRPYATQLGLWRFFEARERAAYPHWSEDEIAEELRNYVSDPRGFDMADPRTWPTHMTGGSVDLTLYALKTGEILDMGAAFDQMGAAAHTDHFERRLALGEIAEDDPRLMHRRLLVAALAAQGLTNYGKEFWHFDWGNQMHQMICALSGDALRPAVYGAVHAPK